MEDNQYNKNARITSENVYINSVLDSISNFIDKKELIPAERIIIQKDKFIERNQLQEQNLIKIQRKLQETEFLKQELEIEKDKNKQLTISNNNKDIELQKKIVDTQNIIKEPYTNIHPQPQLQPSQQQLLPSQQQQLLPQHHPLLQQQQQQLLQQQQQLLPSQQQQLLPQQQPRQQLEQQQLLPPQQQQLLPPQQRQLLPQQQQPLLPQQQQLLPQQQQQLLPQQQQQLPQNYNGIMDKLNEIVSIFNHKKQQNTEQLNPWTGQLFDEHSKLLMNKRIADMDEKLYDIVRKLNQNQNQSSNQPQIIPIYQPFNPYQGYNPNITQNNPQINQKEFNPNYKENETKISENELNNLLSINNNKNLNLKKNNKEENENENENQNENETEEEKNNFIDSKMFINNNKGKSNNIRFKKEKNPFQYIYNNTNDLIFEKTNILNGGNKLLKLKKNRLVKLF
jgi:hypothetical protein